VEAVVNMRSARTIIRPWRRSDDDLADHWPAYNDPLEPLWNLPRAFSSADLWPAAGFSPYERETWAVESYDARLMGRISLREIDRRVPQARLGVTFGAPYIGKGLGTEALTCFIQAYFTDMHYAVMVLDVAAPNERAVRCYERLGFAYIGSDWRQAGSSFDRQVLDFPAYRHLRRYFSQERRGLVVEFFEMRLTYDEWLAHVRSGRVAS
jgi:RimJ/RimL family protein N-acetyltransferase